MARLLVIADGEGVHGARWVEAVSALGHDVRWIATRHPRSKEKTVHVDLLRPLPMGRLKSQLTLFRNALSVRSICVRFDPALIQAQYLVPCGWYGWAASTRHRFTIHLWGSDILKHSDQPAHYRLFSKASLSAATLVTADSANLLDIAAEVAPRMRRGPVLSWGVNTNLFAPVDGEKRQILRQRLEISQSKVVVFTRNFGPDMNVAALIKAFAVLPEDLRGTTILILKKGFPFEWPTLPIRALVEECGLIENIRIIEREWGYEEMASLLGIADVFVSIPTPGRDGLAQSLLDAAASGCLLLVSANPDTLEILRDGMLSGTVVKNPQDREELAIALEGALRRVGTADGDSERVSNREYIRENYEREKCIFKIGASIQTILA